jgi:hypothetical protein
MSMPEFSVDFRFRKDSSDGERDTVMDGLRGKYPVVGGSAGVEWAFFRVQPGGNYYVSVNNETDAEGLADYLRGIPCIDTETIEVARQAQ